jgi:hypothetical protein
MKISLGQIIALLEAGDLSPSNLVGSKILHKSRGWGTITVSENRLEVIFRDRELNLCGENIISLSGWEEIRLNDPSKIAVSEALVDERRINREETIQLHAEQSNYLRLSTVRRVYEEGLMEELTSANKALRCKKSPEIQNSARIFEILDELQEYSYLARLLYRFPSARQLAPQSIPERVRISSLLRRASEPQAALVVSELLERDPKYKQMIPAKGLWVSRAAAFCDLKKYSDADRCIRLALRLGGDLRSDRFLANTYNRIQSHL